MSSRVGRLPREGAAAQTADHAEHVLRGPVEIAGRVGANRRLALGIDARSARIRTRGSDAELIDERIAGQLVIAERCRRRSILCPTDRCEKKGQQSADDGHELAREVTFHGITPFSVKNAV